MVAIAEIFFSCGREHIFFIMKIDFIMKNIFIMAHKRTRVHITYAVLAYKG